MTKLNFLFETERMYIRPLKLTDLHAFNEMQSDQKTMKYVRLKVMDFEENKADLIQLIERYSDKENDFFIYAICLKGMEELIGSVALVKDKNEEDEIGYRFIPKYWGQGFGFEVAQGLISYCRSLNKKKLIANVAVDNLASVKIIEKLDFKQVKKYMGELNFIEIKYILILE